MQNTEIYPTVIDGRKYIFTVFQYGSVWVARATLGSGRIKKEGFGSNPETAALELVKLIEI